MIKYNNKRAYLIESIFVMFFYAISVLLLYQYVSIIHISTAQYYLFVITVSAGLGLFAELSSNQFLRRFYLTLSCLFLIFTLAFRNYTGTDDPAYRSIFDTTNSSGFIPLLLAGRIEPGYLLSNYLISLFTDNYLVAQFIFSSVPICIFYISFEKYREYIVLPLAILLFISSLYFQILAVSLVRIFIACSIIFYSIEYIYNDKNKGKTFLIYVLIAAMFHYSALIMLIFVIFLRKKDYIYKHWKKVIALSMIIFPIAFIFISQIVGLFLGERYDGYKSIGEFTISLGDFDTIPFLLLALFLMKYIPEDKKKVYICNIILLSYSFMIAIYSSIVPLGRCIYYTNLSILFLLPMCYRYSPNRMVKIGIGFMIIAYVFVYLYFTQFTNEQNMMYLFPYENVYFKLS